MKTAPGGAANTVAQGLTADIAERHFGGYALMVIGAAKGNAEGVEPGIEILDINAAVGRYIGPTGPHIDLQRLRLDSGREVLFLLVDPPKKGDPVHLCRQTFQGSSREEAAYSLVDGGIYVRNAGNTTAANATQIEALIRRMDVTPSLDIGLGIEGWAHRFADPSDVRTRYLDMQADKYRIKMFARSERAGTSIMPALNNTRLAVRTPEQVEGRLQMWREKVEAEWHESEDKLLGLMGQGLRFHVSNQAESFLRNVTLTITFHDAKGVWWRNEEDRHEWQAPVDDVEPAPYSRIASTQNHGRLRSGDNPVQWRNRDGNLVVTTKFDDLPPEPEWVSNDDDVVLVCASEQEGPVRVGWMATAADYGMAFRGEITVPAAEPFVVQLPEKSGQSQG